MNDEGSSVWVFEKGGEEVDMRLSKAEVQIFWTGLVVSPVIWVSSVHSAQLRWHKHTSRQANLIQHFSFRLFYSLLPSSNWNSVG